MKQLIVMITAALMMSACTPGVGVSVPIGKNVYTGVGVNKHGVHPSVGVGIGL